MPRERRSGSGSRSRSRSRKRSHSKRPGGPDHSDPDRDRASRGRGQRDRGAREGRVRVYMSNVPFGCNESDVWSFLQKYADRSAIVSVDLPLKSDGSGRHRGYATAAFASTFEADFAIRNAHGRALSDPSSSHSRTISVRYDQKDYGEGPPASSDKLQRKPQQKERRRRRGKVSESRQPKDQKQLDSELDDYWREDNEELASTAGPDTAIHKISADTKSEAQGQKHTEGTSVPEEELEDYENG